MKLLTPMIKNKDTLIFATLYLSVLTLMLHYNLTHPVVNDGVYEYRSYLLNIKEGWLYRYSSVNSCLVSIWFPAMLQRMTGLDPYILYRVYPTFFYALAPSFVYLVSRKYFSIGNAITASLVIALSSYILFFPDIGRVGVSLGLLAGLIWALLGKKLLTSLVFATLVVYAHYGIALIAIGLVGAVLIGRLIWDKHLVKVTVATFCTLVLITGGWHFGISHYSGDSMLWTLLHPGEARGVLEDYIPGVRVDVPQGDFFELESRDYVTQEALGRHFATNPAPLKIEIIINWVVVLLITLGLFLALRNRSIDKVYKTMLIVMYCLVASSVIVPSISVFYGTQRVYFTSSLVLATCFPVGANWLSSKMHIRHPVWLVASILVIYGASTSGLIYPVFGLVKSLPVVLTLP